MKKILFLFSILVFTAIQNPTLLLANGQDEHTEQVAHEGNNHSDIDTEQTSKHSNAAEEHHAEPATWSVIPFILILLMIATGPLFYAHFWHKNYPIISILLGLIVVLYYIFILHDVHHPIHSLMEYFSFIALIAALFVSSGGILIKIDKKGTPLMNVAILIFGAMIANIIGTTGASMLLIRPFIRLNQDRIKPYHVVFFIFMVSNVGGNLTPIGDPPLFLGFLKGVEFFWTTTHLWQEWIVGIGLLSIVFYFFDKNNQASSNQEVTYTGKVQIIGAKNIIFLAITIGAVFIDPAVMNWVPALHIDGTDFSFIREIIMLSTAVVAYKMANKEALKGNEFNFEPIREVGFLFIGIFATMMPALQLVGEFAKNNTEMITRNTLYWATGALSGVLDNAPTYLNFLAAGMGKAGLDIGSKADVVLYMNREAQELIAISVAAVFFGAMTYIGNAPNFMVKSIAEQVGIKMPSFVTYIVKYSLPILLPILLLVWVIFFVLI